jgi:transcriptional regulator with XRE-family HTH domain
MLDQMLLSLRNKYKLSQQEVATKIGVTRVTYAAWESGEREPGLAELRLIARLYEMSLIDLLKGEFNQFQSAKKVSLLPADDSIRPREEIVEEPEKLRQVLLYVLDKVGAKPNVGETVLYKLLYFIDFDHYQKFGKSITGLTYIHNHYGPTPKAQTFSGVVEAMAEEGEIDIVETRYFNHLQKKYLPTIKASLDKLSAQELQHIDETLARLADKSAAELTELSHLDTPWIATQENEVIDYQFAMYRGPITSVKEPEDEL